jgi:eukaryotic-like serine/threonine-protein kinase
VRFSKDAMRDVLRLMLKPVNTRVDARIAREICVRDGDIRALLAGRVEKLGATYVLTSQIVNPRDGAVMTTLSEQASAQSELPAAIRRQSLRSREALGEMLSTVRQSETALETATTPSLHALQLYSQASAFMHGEQTWKHEPAERLLRQAVTEDPDFASAHILLAWAVHNEGRLKSEFIPSARQAAALANRASDVERYFILGSYYSLLADATTNVDAKELRRQAISAYQALLRIKPDSLLGCVEPVPRIRPAEARAGSHRSARPCSRRQADRCLGPTLTRRTPSRARPDDASTNARARTACASHA